MQLSVIRRDRSSYASSINLTDADFMNDEISSSECRWSLVRSRDNARSQS
ncbi:MAG: hypothetical protein AB1861_15540 [Cyanobacteriota bacterium]